MAIIKNIWAAIRRKNRISHYLGNGRILTWTDYGKPIILNGADLSLTPHILLHGTWEDWFNKKLPTLIKPGMRIAEVGANVGYYTLWFSELVGPSGHVHAFEAVPQIADNLFHSLHLNHYETRATVHRVAVSNKKGRMKFHVFDRYQGGSSFFVTAAQAKRYHDIRRTISVKTDRLDDLLRGEKIDFLKIDAEGAEPWILQGAEKLIENPDIMIMLEFVPRLLAVFPGGAPAFLDQLTAKGFQFFLFASRARLVPISRDKLLEIAHCEILLRRRR